MCTHVVNEWVNEWVSESKCTEITLCCGIHTLNVRGCECTRDNLVLWHTYT